MSSAIQCMYDRCTKQSQYILEVKKKQVWLCRDHFNQLAYRMVKAAERRGGVSIKDLEIIETSNGKIKLVIRRVKRR